jgi:hypothetical protein
MRVKKARIRSPYLIEGRTSSFEFNPGTDILIPGQDYSQIDFLIRAFAWLYQNDLTEGKYGLSEGQFQLFAVQDHNGMDGSALVIRFHDPEKAALFKLIHR